MVVLSKIRACNTALTQKTAPRVSVFIGGTSGVGQYTIRALVDTGLVCKIYIVCRPTSVEQTRTFVSQMSAINPHADLHLVEGEVSLLEDTNRICKAIEEKETSIDLLFLSAGYAPFGARRETREGLEIAGSLEYYSRMLSVRRLLPLIQKSGGRVISVLAGGKEESTVDLDDLELKNPKNYGGFKAQVLYATMNTVTMEKLADDHPNVTFIHSFPGWVDTGNMSRGHDPGVNAWLSRNLVSRVVSFFCMDKTECGQRNLFQCTSSAYGGSGQPWDGDAMLNSRGQTGRGLFLLSDSCEVVDNGSILSKLRQRGQPEIWKYTNRVLQAYL